jgi:hypothetical protein
MHFELSGEPVTGDVAAEISQLYHRYSLAFDFGEVDAWVDTFVADGTLSLDRVAGVEVLVGAEALRAKIEGKIEGSPPSPRPVRRHATHSLVLLVQADGAIAGRCYFTVHDFGPSMAGEGGPVLASAGIYRDRLVRTSAGWRFQHRSVVFDL